MAVTGNIVSGRGREEREVTEKKNVVGIQLCLAGSKLGMRSRLG